MPTPGENVPQRKGPSGPVNADPGGGIVPPAGQIGGTTADPLIIGITSEEGLGDELTLGFITDGEFLKRVGTEIQSAPAASTSDDVTNLSDVEGANVTAALNALGLGSLLRGADLDGTATNNLTRSGGTVYVMQPDVTTGARIINLLSTGSPAPVYPFTFVLVIYPQDHQVTIVNGASGGAGDTLYTIAAGESGVFYAQYDNLNYNAAGFGDVEPLP